MIASREVVVLDYYYNLKIEASERVSTTLRRLISININEHST